MRVSRLLFLLFMIIIVDGKRGGASRSRGVSRSRIGSTGTQTKSFKITKRIATIGSVERTSLFRSTILGATAGYVTFRAGKHIINDASGPIEWSDRSYYWDSRFMPPSEENPTQCIHQLDPNDPQLGRVYFEDDTRPTEIVYGCGAGQVCCGFECCEDTSFFKSLFSLLVLILILSVFGIFLIEAFRWCINCIYSVRHHRPNEFQVLSI